MIQNKEMNTLIKTFITMSFIFLSASGCKDVYKESKIQELKVTFRKESETKSPFTSSFAENDKIGIQVLSIDGTAYNDIEYNNICCTAQSSRLWTMDQTVELTEESGLMYAYFPYDATIDDISQIPIKAENQTDWMWGTVSGFCNIIPSVPMTMKHALAAIQFNITQESHTNNAQVTSIKIIISGTALNATLNAADGTLTIIEEDDIIYLYEDTYSLSDIPKEYDIIVIPTEKEVSIYIELIINGIVYSGNYTTNEQIDQGVIQSFTVNIETESNELQIHRPQTELWKEKTDNYSTVI